MFKDKLKKDLDNLNPSNRVKEEILKQIYENKPKKIYSIRFASAIAACLAIVIAIGIVIDGRKIEPIPEKQTSSAKTKSTNNIKKIYEYIKEQNVLYEGVDDLPIVDCDGSNISATRKYSATEKMKDAIITKTTSSTKDYYTTNTRELNVDEEDVIKTNGDYIYRLTQDEELFVYKADGEKTELINQLDLFDLFPEFYEIKKFDFWAQGIYLYGEKLIIISQTDEQFKTDSCNCEKCQTNEECFTVVSVFDVKNPEDIKLVKTLKQQGSYDNSRIIGNVLYINSNMHIDVYQEIKKREKFKYVPSFIEDQKQEYQKDENILLADNFEDNSYTIFASYDLNELKRIDDKSIFGDAQIGYVSNNNVYFTEEIYSKHTKTQITKFSLEKGKINNKKSCIILGSINDTFSMDENGEYLRLVATQNQFSNNSYNSLIILDENLKEVSSIEKLAKGERIYSARFMGDYAYFVTFKETDPLFCADLSNPQEPKILSKLKIPGFSDYLHPFDENKLFGFGKSATKKGRVTGVKLSMFDITDKTDITEEATEKIEKTNSSANDNYKAIVISKERNLIGFSITNKEEIKYCLYGYDEENGFYEKLSLDVSKHIKRNDWFRLDTLRGLYIDDYFYISCNDKLIIVDLNNFKVVKTI